MKAFKPIHRSNGEKPPLKSFSIKKAFLIVLCSMFVVLISFAGCFFYFKRIQEKQRYNPAYTLTAIMQTTVGSDQFKTVYLTELLGLSVDQPTNLYTFNVHEAKKKLLECPVLKDVSLKKIFPSSLQINYQMRKPIAFLGDFVNAALDGEGVVFPFKPFYTPKNLPEIVLGEENSEKNDDHSTSLTIQWGRKIRGRRIEMAFAMFSYIATYCMDQQTTLRSIDVSKAFEPSCGQKEIVIIFEDSLEKLVEGKVCLYIYPRILRLSPENYRQQLANYLVLRNYLRVKEMNQEQINENTPIVYSKDTIVDLRLVDLAFIKTQVATYIGSNSMDRR